MKKYLPFFSLVAILIVIAHPRLIFAVTKTVILSYDYNTTGNLLWSVPVDWRTPNSIEVIGGGASGANNSSGNGGGGGAYAKVVNLVLSAGSTVTYLVGEGGYWQYGVNASGVDGGDTYFNGSNCAAASVCARGGSGGGAGGSAGSSIGTVRYSGGSGSGGGGGGGAGPNGNGNNGSGTSGGSGGAGYGGAGGQVGLGSGAGSGGKEWGKHGSGGGASSGAQGGQYGGGGGGASGSGGGIAGDGVIFITYDGINVAKPIVTAPASGITGISNTFNMVSSTTDSSSIRYGIDWDNTGSIDEWVPAVGYAPSGTSQSTTHAWSFESTYTYAVVVQSDIGMKSPTTTKTITIGLPPPTVLLTASSYSYHTGDPAITLTFSSSNASSCIADFSFTPGQALSITPTRVILASGSSWSVPADWLRSGSMVEAIGGGGGGGNGARYLSGGGGGAGAYAKKIEPSLSIGSSIAYAIGAAGTGGATGTNGGDTWFINSATLLAKGGSGATSGIGGAGGSSGSSVGDMVAAGGSGGDSLSGFAAGGAGGGGAAGPNGSGRQGGTQPVSTLGVAGGAGGGGHGGGSIGGNTTNRNVGAAGGNNYLGVGGGAGGPNTGAGQNGVNGGGGGGGGAGGVGGTGGSGNEWTTAGSGGGGGGGGASGVVKSAGSGGLYGGGGGGGGATLSVFGTGGNGAQGVIAVSYYPLATSTTVGSGQVTPADTIVYTVTCTGPGGQGSDSKTIDVTHGSPPMAPTIDGPVSGGPSIQYPFSFTSTDPDNDTLRYGIDWNMDSVVDEWVPSAGYVTSGTQGSTNHAWGSPGMAAFQALAEDASFATSTWAGRACTPVNVCGLSPNQSNIYNSCTGALVQSCASACGNGICVIPPPPTEVPFANFPGGLRAIPYLVHQDESIKLYWNVTNVYENTCSVTSSSGESWNGYAFSGASGTSSAPILERTTFVLQCTGLDNSLYSSSVVVNMLPVFREI